MYNKNIYIIKRIKGYVAIRRFVTFLCIASLTLGLLFFATYLLVNKRQTIKYVADRNKEKIRMEKIMTNPRMIFEYDDNQFYNIKAKQAIHKDESDILFSDVIMEGGVGNIKAGKLLVSNDGDTLDFSDKPVLIIKNQAQNN